MKKAFFVSGVLFSLLVIGFLGLVVSAQAGSSSDTPGLVKNATEKASDYVVDFVQKRGISSSDVSMVREVDFNSLPKDVNIQAAGDHNLAIYEISYNDQEKGTQENVYVVSYSTEKIRKQGDLIVAQDKRNFLSFGYSGEMPGSGFLKTASDVETSLEKGYVMMRKGSITAISTNLEVSNRTQGDIELIVYVNGQEISFGNLLSTESAGVKKDYDVMSKGAVTFRPGDVISAEVKGAPGAVWKDVNTLIEITTEG